LAEELVVTAAQFWGQLMFISEPTTMLTLSFMELLKSIIRFARKFFVLPQGWKSQ